MESCFKLRVLVLMLKLGIIDVFCYLHISRSILNGSYKNDSMVER